MVYVFAQFLSGFVHFFRFFVFFALKHFCTEIFIRLDMHIMLRSNSLCE